MTAAPEPGAAAVTSDPERLGPDLEALVAALDAPVRRIVTLTRLRAPGVEHASFRLELLDGRVLKGRRLPSAEHAARVATILDVMDRRHFPPVIARLGEALLEEWRPGEPLDHATLGPGPMRQCGGILGAVHGAVPPAVEVDKRARPEARLAAVRWQSRKLVRAGALSAASRDHLVALLKAQLPADPAIGVIHRDFCAENLVWDASGQPHVVDNETMQIGALDFDLARTWYRWPMTDTQATAFLDGYSAHRSPESFLASFVFWTLAVLVDVSRYHLRVGTDRAQGAVDLLQAILDGSPAVGRWCPAR